MSEHTDNASQEVESNVKQKSRNFEAVGVMFIFCIIWLAPFVTGSRGGGLGGIATMAIGLISTALGALLFFYPLRWLIRLSLDSEKKFIPRLVLFAIFSLLLTYTAFNIKPPYIKTLEQTAYEYYSENPHEFENPVEGKTINIDILSGPYFAQFIFTETEIPIPYTSGIVIDYKNGWYFEGALLAN